MKFTPDEIRQMGHDPDTLRGDGAGPCEETSVRFAVPGRPKPKANGIKAHRKPSADYEEDVAQVARQATPRGWPTDRRYRLDIWVVYSDGRVGDVTNVQKSVEDALDGLLWDDDRQVDHVKTVREIDKELAGCAVGVEVTQIEPPSVPDWVRLETEVAE